MRAHLRIRLLALMALGLLAGLGLAQPRAAAQAKGERYALLVGIDEYRNPDISPLQFAVADVTAVSRALVEHLGFPKDHVVTMTSDVPDTNRLWPSHDRVLEQIQALGRKLKPEDTLFFYFSGHGFTRDGSKHFLATVNANPATGLTLKTTSLPMDLLAEAMAEIKANNTIFIIDACRNDPEKGGRGDAPNLLTGTFARDLQRVAAAPAAGAGGHALLLACSEGQRAWEWREQRHGVFTYHLLQGIESNAVAGPNKQLPVGQLATYVKTQVQKWGVEHNRPQNPEVKITGSLVLAKVEPNKQDKAFNVDARDPLIVNNPQGNIKLAVALNHKDGVYRNGDELMVNFRVQEPCYVTIFNRTCEGTYIQLFPNRFVDQNLCTPGKDYSIGNPGDPFKLPVRAPFGKESIIVVATKEKLPVNAAAIQLAPNAPVAEVKAEGLKAFVAELREKNPDLWDVQEFGVTTMP